jgi:regulator of protease activity HflC (stomatin/prohibitin superfamily)
MALKSNDIQDTEAQALGFLPGVMVTLFFVALAGVAGLMHPFFAGLPVFCALLCLMNFHVLHPKQAAVLEFFGHYIGTKSETGIFWTIPFTKTRKVSLEDFVVNTPLLKINDRAGNPLEAGGSCVMHVDDAASSCYNVENVGEYCATQVQIALRETLNAFTYDETRTVSKDFTERFRKELVTRLSDAGVKIKDAKLTHVAYAPEIASAMLRQQQAQAVIAARKTIVNGAVGMVEDALESIKKRDMATFTPEQQAALVSNLLLVLCSEKDVTPTLQMNK